MLRRRAGRTIFVWALRFPRVVSIQFRENGWTLRLASLCAYVENEHGGVFTQCCDLAHRSEPSHTWGWRIERPFEGGWREGSPCILSLGEGCPVTFSASQEDFLVRQSDRTVSIFRRRISYQFFTAWTIYILISNCTEVPMLTANSISGVFLELDDFLQCRKVFLKRSSNRSWSPSEGLTYQNVLLYG